MNIIIFSSQAEPTQTSFQLINYEFWNHQHAYSRNAGAYKIATKMRELGHTVEVVDFITYWHDKDIKAFIDNKIHDVDVVGWSSQFFFNIDFYKKWCAYIKEVNPNVTFITGGPKVENLLNFTESKYLIAGYAEDAIEDVLNHISKKSNKLKFKIVNNQFYVDCLTQYTMTTLPSMEIKYQANDYIIPSETLTLSMSRGCIFKCSFCTYPYIGKKKNEFSRQGAETYYNELMHNYNEFGVTNYFMSDETTNDSIDKLKDIEEAVQRLPFKPRFTGFARLDLLTRQKEYWQLYKNIGLTHWHFGIESFNPKSLKSMTKGFSPILLQQTLKELKDFFKDDATIFASFIVGAPYDTPETFEKLTINWLENDGKGILDGMTFFPLNIHRESEYAVGSELSRNYRAYGYREMSDERISEVLQLHTGVDVSTIVDTKRYNIMWETDHWNVLTVEELGRRYRAEVQLPNNISPWTRAKLISVGVTDDEIKQAQKPNTHLHSLFKEYERRLPICLNAYIEKKLNGNKNDI